MNEKHWKPFVINWMECTECCEEWSVDYESPRCLCKGDEE